MNKILLSILFFTILVTSCTSKEKVITKAEVLEYFKQISFGNEFTNVKAVTKKWNRNMKIFIHKKDRKNLYLHRELKKIVKELNRLLKNSNVELEIVNKRKQANYIVYFGDRYTYYKEVEPNAKKYVDGNWGLFWIFWDGNFNIYKGSMYVDITRANKKEAKHLLREELTQSLGLMNDSYKYYDSIFQQNWTRTNSYAEIDKRVIKLLYNNKIKANMNYKKVKAVTKNISSY